MTPTVRTLAAVVPGVALVALAGTMLDLPRADFIDALDSDRYRILWITGSYLAGSAAGMCLTALSAQLLGLRRAYLLGLLLFTITAGLCGGVTEVIWMTPLRFLQGFGAGQVLSPGMVLVWRAFPQRRDAAMTVYGLGVYLAVLAGAVLGGLLTTYLSWRWLFWINVPLGAVVLLAARRLLPADPPRAAPPTRFDFAGFILFLLFVVSLTVTLDMGQYWGWVNSPFFVPWLVLFVVSFLGFVAWGLFRTRPVINLRPFGRRNFGVGIVLKALVTINVTVLLNLVSGYMIGLRGYQWWQGSLVFLPALAVFVMALLGSLPWARASNRRLRIALGLGVMAAATWSLSGVDLYTNKYWLAALFALWGLGVGLAVAPIMAALFDGLSLDETLQGAGIFNITRALPAFAVGAILITLLTQRTDTHFDRLRQRITRNHPLVQMTEDRARRHFDNRGQGAADQTGVAHALLGRWVHANARAEAFQDVLAWLALATACGPLLTLALRPPRTQA